MAAKHFMRERSRRTESSAASYAFPRKKINHRRPGAVGYSTLMPLIRT
jgi:hypothetical protein